MPRSAATVKFVIPRACDFFDLFVFFAPDAMFFNPLQRRVILSEAPSQIYHMTEDFMARSRRTPAMLVGTYSSELSGHRLHGELKKSQPLRRTGGTGQVLTGSVRAQAPPR